jgi:hypothetical protein
VFKILHKLARNVDAVSVERRLKDKSSLLAGKSGDNDPAAPMNFSDE